MFLRKAIRRFSLFPLQRVFSLHKYDSAVELSEAELLKLFRQVRIRIKMPNNSSWREVLSIGKSRFEE